MSGEGRPPNKTALRDEIDQAWTDLETMLGRLTEAQLTTAQDAEGWTVKDHLVHIAVWERSVVALLKGRPRYEGLGVDEQLFHSDDVEAINAHIHERRKDEALADVMRHLRATHHELLELLEPLGDDDLLAVNSGDQPEDRGERDERPIIDIVYTNTAGHFREHQGWIQALVTPAM